MEEGDRDGRVAERRARGGGRAEVAGRVARRRTGVMGAEPPPVRP
jgi:hypothetical protein